MFYPDLGRGGRENEHGVNLEIWLATYFAVLGDEFLGIERRFRRDMDRTGSVDF